MFIQRDSSKVLQSHIHLKTVLRACCNLRDYFDGISVQFEGIRDFGLFCDIVNSRYLYDNDNWRIVVIEDANPKQNVEFRKYVSRIFLQSFTRQHSEFFDIYRMTVLSSSHSKITS